MRVQCSVVCCEKCSRYGKGVFTDEFEYKRVWVWVKVRIRTIFQ